MIHIQAIDCTPQQLHDVQEPFSLNLSFRTRSIREMQTALQLLADALPQIARSTNPSLESDKHETTTS